MAKFTSLDIAGDTKHAIANGIFNAVTNDIPELIQDNNLPSAVGSGLFRWNFINRNVSDNLGGTFQTSYAKRGAWKVLLLYERNTEFTFSIMTEKNLSRLKKHLPEGIHYLEALLSKNTGYDVIEGQIKLDTFEKSRDLSLVDRLREQLLNDFAGIIKNHILITNLIGCCLHELYCLPQILESHFRKIGANILTSPILTRLLFLLK